MVWCTKTPHHATTPRHHIFCRCSVDSRCRRRPRVQEEEPKEGEESKIAFNARFLTDVLNVMRGDDVVLETTTPSSPGLFRSDKLSGYSHVIMPMYVQW